MNSRWFRFAPWAVLMLSLWANQAWAEVEFEGIYRGEMSLNVDGRSQLLPLQLSLVFTGDTVTRSNGDVVQVIEGSFLIDGEGGIYSFKKVELDLANGRIDLRYVRAMGEGGEESPASFRLVGDYRTSGTINGRVFSGSRGPLGTFSLVWVRSTGFETKSNYLGQWKGFAVLTNGGSKVAMSLKLVDANGSTTNPTDMEFEYTPGKLANLNWNDLRFSANNVSIDFLSKLITMRIPNANGGPGLSVEFEINAETGAAHGMIISASQGKTATFELPAE